MDDHLTDARRAVVAASDAVDDATVREQLRSIEEGLSDLSGARNREDDDQLGDELRTIEDKLSGLLDETDGVTRERIADARDHIDAYRRADTQDW